MATSYWLLATGLTDTRSFGAGLDARICNQCRVTRGFSVKRSCPGARSYTYEE